MKQQPLEPWLVCVQCGHYGYSVRPDVLDALGVDGFSVLCTCGSTRWVWSSRIPTKADLPRLREVRAALEREADLAKLSDSLPKFNTAADSNYPITADTSC